MSGRGSAGASGDRAGEGTFRRWFELAGWLVVTFAAAGVGAAATGSAPDFYLGLSRPGWAPPPGVFGPVWTVLYALMAVAVWLVWTERDRARVTGVLALFGAQLAANALWSWLFFAWRLGAVAFAEILLLLVLIGATTRAFWRVRRTAAVLLVPYLVWVCYAAALTLSVWRRNPGAL